MENLKDKTLAALFWNLSERVGVQIIQFIPTVVLARLLSPEQFGLIGMLSLFIAVANASLEGGFSTALIQKKEATYVDECSVFYYNLFIGGCLALVLFLAAPWIAAFYRQPVLTALTRVLTLQIIINAFGVVQTARLTRRLDFKTQLKAHLCATLASGIVGMAAAYGGWGVWSLAAQSIAKSLLGVATLWVICDWRPGLVFSMASLKGMFGFGSRMYLSTLVSVFFENLHQAFIGKVFSAGALGQYTRAASIKQIAVDTTSNTVGRVMYPALASIQQDAARLQRAYRKSILLATFVHFPMMAGLIVLAKPLVNLLFGAKWGHCAVLLQLMCGAGYLYPLQLINLHILKVKGRSDLFLRLEVIKRVMILASLLFTYRWGISAILIGQIAISGIGYFLNSYYSERLIDYPMRKQMLDILPASVFSCLMSLGMLGFAAVVKPAGYLVSMVLQTVVGTTIYLLLHRITRSESLHAMVLLARIRRDPAACTRPANPAAPDDCTTSLYRACPATARPPGESAESALP